MFLTPFGDSHVYFWGRQSEFPGPSLDPFVPNMYWLGPAKAYGLSNHTENQTREKFEAIKKKIEDKDSVPIACFGEIDLRVNCAEEFIFHGRDKHITDLVDSYLDRLSTVNSANVIIWGPVPSAPDDGLFSNEYPAYGDNQTRNYITHLFNKTVIEKIVKYPNLKFITLFYDLITTNLLTKQGALEDGCHLSKNLQPHAVNLVKHLLATEKKIVINRDLYLSVKNYRRVFLNVKSAGNKPYINFYKQKTGKVLNYFSYSPLFDGQEEIQCAGLAEV